MSTVQPRQWRLPLFLFGFLVIVGLGLLFGCAYLLIYWSEEVFVAAMAAAGGATMLVAAAALLLVRRRGARAVA
jgi:peptidoglycan/LPS O-acetylase OafA/YrhL